jgi:hypothetical protein
MEIYSTSIALLLSTGVGLIFFSSATTLIELIGGLFRRTRQGRLSALGIQSSRDAHKAAQWQGEDAIRKIPWNALILVNGLVGIGLWMAVPSVRWFGLLMPVLVWVTRRYLLQQQTRFLNAHIRAFLLDLRLYMSLRGSLLLGLQSIEQSSISKSILVWSLRHNLAGASAQSGLVVLRKMVGDIQSAQFTKVVRRIESAGQSGGLTDLDQAIARAVDELSEEISYQTEEQMQHLPTRITLLAMPFLLGPIVILLFYPLVDRILQTLSGVGIGGGF